MKRHTIIPLVDVADYSDTVTCLDLDIPNVEPETLGVDIHRLHRVMHWGGIGRLAIGSYEGDTTQYTASAVRLNPDGTLSGSGVKVASKAKLAAQESEKLMELGDKGLYGDLDWRNVAIYLNSPALEEVVDEDPVSNLKTIDKSFRASLGREIVSAELAPKNIAKEALVASFVAGSVAVMHLNDANLALETLHYARPKVVWPLATLIFNKTVFKDSTSRLREVTNNDEISAKYSTMYAWRFDRVLLAGRLLTRKLITELPDSK